MCTVRSADTSGVFGISPAFDSLGPMAKTSSDLASVLGVLLGGKDFSSSLRGSCRGLRIGFVDSAMWQPADFVVEPNEGSREQTVRRIYCLVVSRIPADVGSVRCNARRY